MKDSKELSRVNDSDLYLSVSLILVAFNKNTFAVIAFLLFLGCVIGKNLIEYYEDKNK